MEERGDEATGSLICNGKGGKRRSSDGTKDTKSRFRVKHDPEHKG
jgi:hypothetical protein